MTNSGVATHAGRLSCQINKVCVRKTREVMLKTELSSCYIFDIAHTSDVDKRLPQYIMRLTDGCPVNSSIFNESNLTYHGKNMFNKSCVKTKDDL